MVEIIIYSNNDNITFRNLRKSLDKNGFKYTHIGKGDEYKGFITMMEGFQKYLSHLMTIDPERVVVKLDAHDAYAIGRPLELEQILKSFPVDKQLIAFGELNNYTFFPFPYEYYKYYGLNFAERTYPYVNSGCICGKVKHIFQYFVWAVKNKFDDDQVALIKYMDAFPERVFFDTECRIVANLTGTEVLTRTIGNRAYNRRTKTLPILIHIPGRYTDFFSRMDYWGKTILQEEYEPTSWNDILQNNYKMSKKNLFLLVRSKWFILILLSFLIFAIIVYLKRKYK
jgi:nitrogen fixation-related uncharacterized protein